MGQSYEERKGEMKGMNSKKLKGIDIKEVFAYAVLIAFFFWWQKFFPSISFAYIEKVTLGVRVLYSIVLADTVISSVKKILKLLGKKSGSESAENSNSSDSVDQSSMAEEAVSSEQNSKLSRIGDFLFYASFALCFGLQLLSSTRFPSIIHLFAGMQRLGVNLSCIMAIFLFNRKPAVDMKILIFQLFILIADIGFLAVHDGIWLYPMMIFVVGAYGRRFLSVVYIALIESSAVIVATYYCSVAGYIEMVIKEGGKHGYGYAGPNEASMQYLFFLMMYFFARYYVEKKSGQNHIFNVVDALILAIGLKFIVSYSSGRASIVCVSALAVGAVIYKLSKLYQVETWPQKARNAIDKAFLFLFVPVFGYATTLSFASAYFFNPEKPYGWILKLGEIVDTETFKLRLYLGKQALMGYKPSVFGTFVRESLENDTYFIIDNSYIKAYLQYGLIYFVCTLLIFTMINYVLWKRKEYFPLFLISIVAGLGFMEAQVGEIQYDIFPLIVFTSDIGWLALKGDGAYNRELWQKKD